MLLKQEHVPRAARKNKNMHFFQIQPLPKKKTKQLFTRSVRIHIGYFNALTLVFPSHSIALRSEALAPSDCKQNRQTDDAKTESASEHSFPAASAKKLRCNQICFIPEAKRALTHVNVILQLHRPPRCRVD